MFFAYLVGLFCNLISCFGIIIRYTIKTGIKALACKHTSPLLMDLMINATKVEGSTSLVSYSQFISLQ